MIKFFRKIRYNLMETGKTSKYVKYAIGEIILVVIGILIALTINNWNETRKANNNEITLLQKLQEENSINLESLIYDVDYRKNMSKIIEDFTFFLEKENLEKENDSLPYFFEKILRSTSYTFTKSSLVNYVKLHNSSYSAFTKELTTLQAFQKDLELISEKAVDIKIKNLFETLENDIDFYSLEIKSFNTLKSLRFKNRIFLISGIEQEISYHFDKTLKQQQKVDSLITSRLKY